jgi:UDP-N-acetylmuramate--alanine ligase
MRALPLSIGTIHFVGIGGIGMSGIAEVLHNLGYSVQGSDIADSANVKRLRGEGIDVAIGHAAANLKQAQVVVVSSAVKGDNPEVQAARAKLIPVVRRAGNGASRPHRHQRRHHQRLWHQHASRRRRLDGRRGR